MLPAVLDLAIESSSEAGTTGFLITGDTRDRPVDLDLMPPPVPPPVPQANMA